MNISVKYEFFGQVRNFRTLWKNSYFTKKFILYNFHTLPKNLYFIEIFILYWKFHTLPKNSYTRWTGAITFFTIALFLVLVGELEDPPFPSFGSDEDPNSVQACCFSWVFFLNGPTFPCMRVLWFLSQILQGCPFHTLAWNVQGRETKGTACGSLPF